ncbi:NnrS family protein [Vibrio sp. DW001]|uniref:NnrS family protein n=1 Tax=Vibrio sp. DW001 TaxID=2912315 RepID=UPI0023B1B741|nr:NnrS family protein [Vibrio sp. DW001]WED25776.1 NnrS family protein [Vibrio sp. DW001]
MSKYASILDFDAPLYACGFRPFYLLTALYSIALVFHWVLFSQVQSTVLSEAEMIWYSHELVFGIGSSAIAGFLLTAFPAWTNTPRVSGQQLMLVVTCWALSRIFAWGNGYIGLTPMALANIAFVALLLWHLFRPVVDKKQRRHRIFYYQLWLYFTAMLVVYYLWISGNSGLTLQWLQTSGGIYIIMLMTVLSRMSMVVVNHALERFAVTNKRHLAKPPRRDFSIGIILIYLAIDLWLPSSSISGWLALACAASVLNILNDWHLPKAWRDIYYQSAYSFYLFIAAGFVAIGWENIWGTSYELPAHMLFSAAAGIAVMLAMLVVGQKHTGYPLDYLIAIRLMLILMPAVAVLQFGMMIGAFSQQVSQPLTATFVAISFSLYMKVFIGKHINVRVNSKKG